MRKENEQKAQITKVILRSVAFILSDEQSHWNVASRGEERDARFKRINISAA